RGKRMRDVEPEDPFAAHHEHMRQMMRSFSEPFGRDPFLSLPEAGEKPAGRRADRRAQQDSQMALRGVPALAGGAADLFKSLPTHSIIPCYIYGFPVHFSALCPDGHSFSSSSMMTYSKVGDEPPKVFQASAQTRTAPGGVKETRRAMKDSESGLEKMAIGHHLQDRAHVIKKCKNSKTGDEEMNQEFINMDEAEADTFDEEWQREIMKFRPCRSRGAVEAPRSRSTHYSPRENRSRR
uniref:Myeloid leukemia factor 1 n=1 Tax=Malurus cyaneus samueli TaxID=2593467 RepID=A0A8C5U0I3_9PASS